MSITPVKPTPMSAVGDGPITVNFTIINEGREELGSATVEWGDNSDKTMLALTKDPSTGLIASHTYLMAGEFDITITVKDDDGNVVVSKITIHVGVGMVMVLTGKLCAGEGSLLSL